MALPPLLRDSLRLPVIGAPMFIVSGPELVLAQCKAGIVGAFPALNARPQEQLDVWLTRIERELAEYKAAHPEAKVAPFAVNQIVHTSNTRLQQDLDVCVRHRVPIMITSLRAPDAVVEAAHSYGGLVFHDVTTIKHAKRALEAGVDGLILVCTGAGGHAGRLSPFAFVPEVRQFYDGCVILSGAIASGGAILAAQALGRRPRVHRHALHRERRSERAGRIQADDHRQPRGGHRVHEPLHGRARQLPEGQHRQRGAGSGQPAGERQVEDGLRGGVSEGEGLEGYLGGGAGGGAGGSGAICGRDRPAPRRRA